MLLSVLGTLWLRIIHFVCFIRSVSTKPHVWICSATENGRTTKMHSGLSGCPAVCTGSQRSLGIRPFLKDSRRRMINFKRCPKEKTEKKTWTTLFLHWLFFFVVVVAMMAFWQTLQLKFQVIFILNEFLIVKYCQYFN